MKRLTRTYADKTHGVADDLPCGENSRTFKDLLISNLGKYEDLGYTPEELQLCFNPPEVLYIINEIDEKKIHPIYPVDGNQIEFSYGNVYWNCRDEFGDYVELPLEGLHEEYFLTSVEADNYVTDIVLPAEGRGKRHGMKKLFISQPMVDRTDEEILAEREKAIAEARKILGEDIEVIDSYTDVLMNPLGYLGYSISCLSKADVAYFAKGWQDHRGCRIEHICAVDYGIKVIMSEFDPHKTTIGKRLDAGLWD